MYRCLALLMMANGIVLSHAMEESCTIKKGRTVNDVFHAIKQRNCEELKTLVWHSPTLLKEAKKGHYPIHKAAKMGFSEIIEFIIHQGVEIDQRSYWGKTALMVAAEGGNLEMVTFLIARGSDVYQKDLFGHSSIGYAIFNGHKNIVKFFLDTAKDVKKFFVDQYLYYQGRNRDTNNLLTLASKRGHIEMVQWLLDAGAPMNVEDPYDVRPLDAATKGGYYALVKLLLEHGAAVDDYSKIRGPFYEDIDEPRPLISAIQNGDLATVQLLLNYGADKDKRYCGRKPLKHAKSLRYLDIANLLKKHKYHLIDVSSLSIHDNFFNESVEHTFEH